MGKKRRAKLERRKQRVADLQPQRPAARGGRGAVVLAIIAVAVVVTVAVVAFARHMSASTTQAASPQQTPGIHYPSQGHQGHMGESMAYIEHFKYSSDPPTSGAHREIFSKAFVNTKPLPKYVQVHLIEHGNVLLQYHCFSCPQIASQLAAIAYEYDDRLGGNAASASANDVAQAEEQGAAVIVAPDSTMHPVIALTAWTRALPLNAVDKPQIYGFINAYLHNADNIKQ